MTVMGAFTLLFGTALLVLQIVVLVLVLWDDDQTDRPRSSTVSPQSGGVEASEPGPTSDAGALAVAE